MKIEILEETKDKIKFNLIGARHSIPEMLKNQLLNYKEVTLASGMLKHFEDENSEFLLIVKNANPREILIKAIEELQKEINSFKDSMLKAIPEDSQKKEVKKKSK